MPKIIEDLKERLLAEAKRQIEQEGYEAVTIRSIAKGCGVGVGTVYNYYPSKEALIAAYLLEDWVVCLQTIHAAAEGSDEPKPVLQCIYEQLTGFAGRHGTVFHAQAAIRGFAGSFTQYHSLLRSQLAEPLNKYCSNGFTADFVSESLMTWSMAGKSFDDIYEVMKKLF